MNPQRIGVLLGLALSVLSPDITPGAEEPGRKLNVLFIAVDDLRPQLGCYGDPVVKSPNIDRLAARGTVFERAYCQQAVCSPSRTSLLTGLRPDSTRVYDLQTHFRDTIPDVVTLPEHFKALGYHSRGLGKIYHGGLDDPQSWSEPHWRPSVPGFGPEGQELTRRLRAEAKAKGIDLSKRQNQIRGLPWEAPDVEDDELTDGATAAEAVRLLGEIQDRPFFLAVGFLKPHLAFVAPKRYWDLYSPEDIQLPENDDPPKGAPAYALSNWGELRRYHGMPSQGPVTDEQARSLIHGYYACASYTDAQVGRLLDELDRLGLTESTAVILWGDHGWKLGEHGAWCKHTNYELDARVPMILAVPGQKAAGKASNALVEFVDIYPTLAEVCGLPLPEGLEGTSFAPLLDDPDRPWKSAAFSQYPRSIPGQGQGMGYAMRTDRYRFVAWTVPGKDFVEYELYDHEVDPGEEVNIANEPENAKLVEQLAGQLRAGWQGARPE
ncbi:sulfatase [soil metagenome]